MPSNFVSTYYSIRELSMDGLLKRPEEAGRCVFDEAYNTLESAHYAILQRGDEFTQYVVLTMTRIESA